MTAAPSFIFGGDTGLSYDQIQQRRKVLNAMMAQQAGNTPRNLGEGLTAVGQALAARVREYKLDQAEAGLRQRQAGLWGDLSNAMQAGGGSTLAYSPSGMAGDGNASAADTGAPAAPLSTKPGDENIYSDFIGTVKNGGLTNPYGLAAVAATGRAESGYSAGNAYRQWSDPSESGQAGMAGGIMSWRAGRLQAMRDFAARNGDDPNRPSAKTQGAFFLSEDPGLIQKLNGAKSVGEAQTLMNNAWAFKGYDRPGGEAARRLSTAQSYLPSFMGGPEASAAPAPADQPVQVASLDPSIGMDSALAYNPRGNGGQPPSIRQALGNAIAAQPAPDAGAQLAALPAAQTVQSNPVPPNAVPAAADAGLSDAVRQAAASDAGFDGFAQSGQNVQGAPAAPAAPQEGAVANITRAMISRGINPEAPPVLRELPAFASPDMSPVDRVTHAVQVAQAQRGEDPTALVRVLQSPDASPEQRELAGQLLTRLYGRQDLTQKRQAAWEDYQRKARFDAQLKANDPDVALDRQYRRAQIDALGQKDPTQTNDIREYEFAKSQGFPGTFTEYQQALRKAGATTVNTGENTSEFVKKSDEGAAKRLGDIVDAGNAAGQMMGDMQQLADLGSRIGTGKGAQVTAALGPYAEMLGIKLDGMDEVQAFNAVASRIAPNMRPAGAGATSDFDARQYLQSIPGLANTPGGNAIIAGTFQSIQENKLAAAEIAQRAQSGEIKWQDAERQIRALPNPYARFKEFQQRNGGADYRQRYGLGEPAAGAVPQGQPQTPSPASGMGGNWPQGGQAARPRTDAEFNALPKGALYIDPDDGKTYRK